MLRPGFYPDPPAQVELKQTHISYVFVAGDFVYKVKKPVHFAFLDCSRLAQRFHYCCEEVRLNARLSPHVYLGVFAILRDAESFVLGPRVEVEHPKAVEYAVEMRRLPEDRMLDRLIALGEVDKDTIRAIAKRIAKFHATAPSNRGWTYGSALSIWRDVIEEIAQNKDFVGRTIREDQFTAIDAFCRAFVNSHWRALNERAHEGRVREGHGDLRAEHICLADDEIDVIDCVEFSERLRYCDAASEIAFLAMDLDRLGAPRLADELVEAYAEISGDEDLGVFVPFYKCYRACVRGKVESLKSLEREVDAAERERARQLASSYFELAARYAARRSPALIVVCGLSGSGKSTVARLLQHRKGFKVINSDRVRKRLAAVPAHEHFFTDYRANMYSDRFTKITYDTMLAEAESLLAGAAERFSTLRSRSLPIVNSRLLSRQGTAFLCSSSNVLSVKKKRYAGWNVADRHKMKCQTPRQRCIEDSARSSSRYTRFRLLTICASIPVESVNSWSPKSRTRSITLPDWALSHRSSAVLDRVEVGNYFADDLANPILTALTLTHLVKFLSPNRHLMTAMRSGGVAAVD